MKKLPVSTAVLVAAALSMSPSALAQITFLKVADTDTLLPGGSETFEGFRAPALDGDNVAFVGRTVAWPYNSGVFKTIGGGTLVAVADLTTIVPGFLGDTTFLFFDDVSISGTEVAFNGTAAVLNSQGVQPAGVFWDVGSTLGKVFGTNDPVPGTPGAVFGPFFDSPSISNGVVAFSAQGSPSGPQVSGIYTSRNGGTVVADTSMTMPGDTGLFEELSGNVVHHDGAVAFEGGGPGAAGFQRGVYYRASPAAPLRVVADRSIPVPGGTETFYFSSTIWMSLDSGIVAFFGFDRSFEGHFTSNRNAWSQNYGPLSVAADSTTPAPGQGVSFQHLDVLSTDSGNVAFTGYGPSWSGLYVKPKDGPLVKVLDSTDSLDGKNLNSFGIGPEALSGNRVAFVAGFTDGSSAIYLAEGDFLPEPSTCSVGAGYADGTLTLDFEVGTSSPATWNLFLSIGSNTFRLWALPLPATDPPLSFDVPLAGFPPLGGVGFLSTLTAPGTGIACSDWTVVSTGAP